MTRQVPLLAIALLAAISPCGRATAEPESICKRPALFSTRPSEAKVVAMQPSEWQAGLAPEDASQNPDELLFRWDGRFAANPEIAGTWQLITEVAEISEFDPAEEPREVRNSPFSTITLKDGGGTADPTPVWSGDTLVDLTRYQALKMRRQMIGDADYLFIESGGFSTRNNPDWKPSWLVLKPNQ